MEIVPIGVFHCLEEHPYDVPRQGVLSPANAGRLDLVPGLDYEQALRELAGFSRIWLIFGFHRNSRWKPMVRPPRHRRRKVGVFASRAPYRPNFLGLSCVELVSVSGLSVFLRGHDLLDGTPVYDIKPYLPYADSFPEASPGWTGEPSGPCYGIVCSETAERQLAWLEGRRLAGLRQFIRTRLECEPLDPRRSRLLAGAAEGLHLLAYRTWRIEFQVDEAKRLVRVLRVFGGYSRDELADPGDPYRDKGLHRDFLAWTEAAPG